MVSHKRALESCRSLTISVSLHLFAFSRFERASLRRCDRKSTASCWLPSRHRSRRFKRRPNTSVNNGNDSRATPPPLSPSSSLSLSDLWPLTTVCNTVYLSNTVDTLSVCNTERRPHWGWNEYHTHEDKHTHTHTPVAFCWWSDACWENANNEPNPSHVTTKAKTTTNTDAVTTLTLTSTSTEEKEAPPNVSNDYKIIKKSII